MKALIEAYQAAILAISKRGTLSSARYEVSGAERAANKSVSAGVYADQSTNTKAGFVAYCKCAIAALVDAAHAEALEMNAEVDAAAAIMKVPAINAYWMNCESMKVVVAVREWDAMHAEALEMNAAIDRMIDEREHVANCEYEPIQEAARINQIGRGMVCNFPEKFGEGFADLKRLAMRLYSTGFVTFPSEGCDSAHAEALIDCRQQWVWDFSW